MDHARNGERMSTRYLLSTADFLFYEREREEGKEGRDRDTDWCEGWLSPSLSGVYRSAVLGFK